MGRERTYTPGPEDVGAILKFDCTAYDAASPYPEVGKTFSIITARVRPGEGQPAPWLASTALVVMFLGKSRPCGSRVDHSALHPW